jgi:hypothetical protein
MSQQQNVWDWLRSCITCGEIHEYRDEPGMPSKTWAHPVDGHPFRRRLSADIDTLQRQYEVSQR